MKLEVLAQALRCELRGDGQVDVTGVAAIEDATPGTLTFLADRRLAHALATTRASAIVLAPDAPEVALPSLRAADPYATFVDAVERLRPAPPRPAAGIHPTAVVAASAVLGPGAIVGPHAVIGERVRLGRNATVHAGAVLYDDASIGDDFVAHAGVVVREGVRIGHRVTLHAGAVIGSDGFGYLPGAEGARKIPQVGTVILEDDVAVGANATVDRAALGATVLGRGTKIDNLVAIAHGCRVGPHCLLAAQTGLAGGTVVGAGVLMGGQVGSAGHLEIGAGAQLGAKAGVHNDVPAGAVFSGYPAVEIRTWRRIHASLPRLPDVLRRLRRIERALGIRNRPEEG
jgi:UDP-3-O-[3-hydroxymyristoyl] glucosamine N-acyltransferase